LGKEESTDATLKYVDFQEYPSFSEFVISSNYQSWWDTNASSFSVLQIGLSSIALSADDPTQGIRGDFLTYVTGDQHSAGISISRPTGVIGINLFGDPSTSSATVTDTINLKGLEYADDYEANFTDRSLVTKQYVDTEISTTTTVTQVTPVTVLASSFTLVGGFYEASIADSAILATSIVEVIPSNASYTIVKDAEFLPETDSSIGSVKVYCVNLPAGDFVVTLNITNP
jgi:hypothetical protein